MNNSNIELDSDKQPTEFLIKSLPNSATKISNKNFAN